MRISIYVSLGIAAALSCADVEGSEALQRSEPVSSLRTYIPPVQPHPSLSSLTPHCATCRILVPDKSAPRARRQGVHRRPREAGSRYRRLKLGGHVHLRPPRPQIRRPVQLPRRSLMRLGLQTGSFDSGQLQAVDGDTIRYGTDRIRVRGLNAPELSETGGLEAHHRLAQLLAEGSIRIVPHGKDVYGRLLADVFVRERNVADVMKAEGFAGR